MIDFKLFQHPQRYIANEWNVIKKPHNKRIPICLCYPDLYEVGMCNLGLRIIYSILNEVEDVVCERAFLPADDLNSYLAENNLKLFSLETKTPLDKFEVLGFNFNYELNFVNFLYMLRLSAIPLSARERKDLIILGGGVANPEPLAEFVDVFYLGEFEVGAKAFIEVLRKHKDKKSRLEALAAIDGFYVPEYYSSELKNNKYEFTKIRDYAKLPIKKTHVKDLNESPYPVKWLTPHTQIVHDRVPIEIARGCPNQCTFCQARASYYPYREKKASRVCHIVKEIYKNSGYENFSLLSLSTSDYSQIDELIDALLVDFKQKRIGLSLPSLRVDDIVGRLYPKLHLLRKTSLTVAVETANDQLRGQLGKKIDTNKLFEAAKIIHSLKLRHIKLYFMIGFEQETEDDLTAIGRFLGRLNIETNLSLNVSINVFVPKPFSLLEGSCMDDESVLLNKIRIVKSSLPRKRSINASFAHVQRSILEAIISRADRGFSSVILDVFKASLNRRDLASDWHLWLEVMRKNNVDYKAYLKPETTNFPWSFIKTGVSPCNSNCQ
ncbi:MAG: radical SAM protein [Candidatus Omnitrophota bacterium]|jgi:radical SAM family uncharacterized protein